MTPSDLFFYFVCAFGLWYIVGYAQISFPFRSWWRRRVIERHPFARYLLDLVQCQACFGFWTGLVWGALTGWRESVVLALATTTMNILIARLAGIDADE